MSRLIFARIQPKERLIFTIGSAMVGQYCFPTHVILLQYALRNWVPSPNLPEFDKRGVKVITGLALILWQITNLG